MQFKKRHPKRLQIEITPLIDVVFLLLIFFMISTTFTSTPGLKVNLPQAKTNQPPQLQQPLEVTLMANGRLYLDQKSIKADRLDQALKELAQTKRYTSLLIRADKEVRHKRVVRVMDAAMQAGIKKLSIGTLPPKAR